MPAALDRLHDALADRLGGDRVRADVLLAPLTTFKIGGPADLFVEARTADELADAITLARESGVPYFLLGLGANILVGDLGFRGLVIRNAAERVSLDPARHWLTAESGAIVYPNLIETAVSAGLSGLEHYVGIPSTVGGALWQNLHFLSPDRTRTMFIEEVLLEADLLTEEGERKTVGLDYFEYGYDDSILHHRDDLVLSATFQLAPHDEAAMRDVMAANLDWRQKRHPPLDTEPSAGSIFQKIEGVGAGRLIDWCGLKGCRIGGAMVTHRHANIFINHGITEGGTIARGGATARDVRHLIAHVQTVVEREQGYRIQPEIKFVGDFGDLPGMHPMNWADSDGFSGGLPPGGHTDAHAESVGR
ncbi:MAG: UDP-N-acetylmuramate dehydrogenase [Bacteroidota bacterium]